MNGLPGVALTIREAGKTVGGDIVFYFQERAGVDHPWHATGKSSLPLLRPHVAGKTLTFEVEHHVCHECAELGPNVAFRLELLGANEARLTRFEDDGTEGAQMKLARGNEATTQAAPPPQRGISVEMPVTRNAAPVPEADREDAPIVTVTQDGDVYVGSNHVGPDKLNAELQRLLSQTRERRLYVKADARAPYDTVVKILDVAAAAGAESTILLTSQRNSSLPETIVPPNGFIIVTSGGQAAVHPRLSL